MNEVYLFCCHRCGSIFESTGDPDFCEECRKVVYSSQKIHVCPIRQKCEVCGNSFVTTATERLICRECRALMAHKTEHTHKEKPVEKAKKHTQSDIIAAAKSVRSEGLSYGEYMAKYRSGT